MKKKIKDVLEISKYFCDWDFTPIQDIIKELQEYPQGAVMDVDDCTFKVYVERDETDQEMKIRLDKETRNEKITRNFQHQEYLRLKAMFEGTQND